MSSLLRGMLVGKKGRREDIRCFTRRDHCWVSICPSNCQGISYHGSAPRDSSPAYRNGRNDLKDDIIRGVLWNGSWYGDSVGDVFSNLVFGSVLREGEACLGVFIYSGIGSNASSNYISLSVIALEFMYGSVLVPTLKRAATHWIPKDKRILKLEVREQVQITTEIKPQEKRSPTVWNIWMVLCDWRVREKAARQKWSGSIYDLCLSVQSQAQY